jgi:hypothetical protein
MGTIDTPSEPRRPRRAGDGSEGGLRAGRAGAGRCWWGRAIAPVYCRLTAWSLGKELLGLDPGAPGFLVRIRGIWHGWSREYLRLDEEA